MDAFVVQRFVAAIAIAPRTMKRWIAERRQGRHQMFSCTKYLGCRGYSGRLTWAKMMADANSSKYQPTTVIIAWQPIPAHGAFFASCPFARSLRAKLVVLALASATGYPARRASSARSVLVHVTLRPRNGCPGASMAGHRSGGTLSHRGPHRLRQDAGRVSRVFG